MISADIVEYSAFARPQKNEETMSNIDRNPAHIQTVDFTRHGKLKVKPNPGFVHARDRNLVAVSVSELGISASNFPIVFVQDPGDKRYVLMAMLGLTAPLWAQQCDGPRLISPWAH